MSTRQSIDARELNIDRRAADHARTLERRCARHAKQYGTVAIRRGNRTYGKGL